MEEKNLHNKTIAFAPLEGITGHIYRTVHARFFGGCDVYFAPFITPSDNERISRKGLRDILPEQNQNLCLKVQVLANQAATFLRFAEKVREQGYDELNLNLGCPMARVVQKGRGAGFLCYPDELDRFLHEIFSSCDMKISVKTRIGFAAGSEMEKLMAVYNRYPLSSLIIHPRTRAAFYSGEPDYAVFYEALKTSKNPVCYNGNIFNVTDYERIVTQFPAVCGVMLGRGAVMNPAIFREIQGGQRLTTHELLTFSDALAAAYLQELKSEAFTLQKMKEIWGYMMQNYPAEKKILKAVKKAGSLFAFTQALEQLPAIVRSI